MFITMFWGHMDFDSGKFMYCNAGHNYPILIRGNGDIEFLKTGGLILGMFPDATYEMDEIQLEKDDTLLCYTDGVTEAINFRDEEFGEERLFQIAKYFKAPSSEMLVKKIVKRVEAFAGPADQYDDMTLFAMKVK